MSDFRPVEPDALVATALRMLPVPDHEPGFWDRLSEALDAERPEAVPTIVPAPSPPPADDPTVGDSAEEEPAPPIELVAQSGVIPPALRRRSNAVLSAVAVAAAVMVVVAGVSLVRDRSGNGGDGTGLAGAPTTEDPTATEPSTSDTTSNGSETPSFAAADGGTATEAVVRWVRALAEGDTDAAWEALTPDSQSDWGGRSAFEDNRSGLAEGFGAWAAAEPDAVLVTSVSGSGDGELVVVTLVGTLQQEGTSQIRADAFPVRVVDGVARLDLDPFSTEMEIVVPGPIGEDGKPAAVSADEGLVLVVPEGVPAPVVRLDDGETLVCGDAPGTELVPLEGSTGQRCEFNPEGGLTPGRRVLTAAFVSADGGDLTARSVVFEAA